MMLFTFYNHFNLHCIKINQNSSWNTSKLIIIPNHNFACYQIYYITLGIRSNLNLLYLYVLWIILHILINNLYNFTNNFYRINYNIYNIYYIYYILSFSWLLLKRNCVWFFLFAFFLNLRRLSFYMIFWLSLSLLVLLLLLFHPILIIIMVIYIISSDYFDFLIYCSLYSLDEYNNYYWKLLF